MRFLRRRREPQADFAQASPRNLYLRSRGDAPGQTRLSRENRHRPAEAICALITQSAIPIGGLPPTLERRDYTYTRRCGCTELTSQLPHYQNVTRPTWGTHRGSTGAPPARHRRRGQNVADAEACAGSGSAATTPG